jgi:hypothetical protein
MAGERQGMIELAAEDLHQGEDVVRAVHEEGDRPTRARSSRTWSARWTGG